MKKRKKHVIAKVEEGSIAQELGICPGDSLLSINDMPIEDIFDYQYLVQEDYIEVLIEKPGGEQWLLEVDKDPEEDLGIEFESGLMDEYKSCRNKCIFCFIDQMPPGMRETLYFKDDDSRLSFLQGNYVTLTNMSDHDIERICRFHLSPLNISFHTMNPKLRCRMLNNRFAGEALKKIDALYKAGIQMNGQIVLCKGFNDGKELEYSIRELMKYLPHLESLSVVPVGLTKYREGLEPLEPFSKEDAENVIDMIEGFQKECCNQYGIHFVHASDEWYFLAGRELPEAESYDDYPQLENGVGMMRLLLDEFQEALEEAEQKKRTVSAPREISLVTGLLTASCLKEMAKKVEERWPYIKIHVYPVINHFFGEKITVSGLLTGQDIIAQLKEQPLGEQLLLPCNLLRSGEDVLLDDLRVADLEKALQVQVNIVKSSGYQLLEAMIGFQD